jgi:hypothetical protein
VDGYLINPAGLTSEGFAVPHALLETHKPFIEMHMSNIEANPDTPRGAPVGPLKSWFSPFATGETAMYPTTGHDLGPARLAEWRRSSTTTPPRPPSGCAGCRPAPTVTGLLGHGSLPDARSRTVR